MNAETIDLLLTLASAWALFSVAGLGVVVLPWTSSETAASAAAITGVVDVVKTSTASVEDCLSRRIVVG